MSAIWGMIDFAGRRIQKDEMQRMKQPYDKYTFDRLHEIGEDEMYFGCGLQCVTKESKNESLPYEDQKCNIYFNGDIYLFNREEISKELDEDLSPDGMLVLRLFQKIGVEAFSKLNGIFSFVIYDREKRILYAVTDKTSTRVLYYTCLNNRIYFSTLIEPILKVRNIPIEWNESWIGTYLGLNNYRIGVDGKSTPFPEIFKLEAATYLYCEQSNIKILEYWNPKIKLRTFWDTKVDGEIKEEFVSLYQKAVKESLRTTEEVGILLSGGLDSGSVAALAAGALEEQGKNLYSFTSIPEDGYIPSAVNFGVVDESKIVDLLVQRYPNIQPELISCHEKNSWSQLDGLLEEVEVPYKSMQNMIWLKEGFLRASKKNCRILLNGQYGNATVSNGSSMMAIVIYFRKGKWKSLFREISCMQKKYGYSRKSLLLYIVRTFLPKSYNAEWKECQQYIYLQKEMKDRLFSEIELRKMNEVFHKSAPDEHQIRNNIYDKKALSQIGEFETKMSLSTGVLSIDPTRNSEIIEFCLSLPLECTVYEGVNRRLIRGYMKELLPDFYSKKIFFSGEQSGDTCQRLRKDWRKIETELYELFTGEFGKIWLDQEKIIHDLKLAEGKLDEDQFFVARILYHGALIKYMNWR